MITLIDRKIGSKIFQLTFLYLSSSIKLTLTRTSVFSSSKTSLSFRVSTTSFPSTKVSWKVFFFLNKPFKIKTKNQVNKIYKILCGIHITLTQCFTYLTYQLWILIDICLNRDLKTSRGKGSYRVPIWKDVCSQNHTGDRWSQCMHHRSSLKISSSFRTIFY